MKKKKIINPARHSTGDGDTIKIKSNVDGLMITTDAGLVPITRGEGVYRIDSRVPKIASQLRAFRDCGFIEIDDTLGFSQIFLIPDHAETARNALLKVLPPDSPVLSYLIQKLGELQYDTQKAAFQRRKDEHELTGRKRDKTSLSKITMKFYQEADAKLRELLAIKYKSGSILSRYGRDIEPKRCRSLLLRDADFSESYDEFLRRIEPELYTQPHTGLSNGLKAGKKQRDLVHRYLGTHIPEGSRVEAYSAYKQEYEANESQFRRARFGRKLDPLAIKFLGVLIGVEDLDDDSVGDLDEVKPSGTPGCAKEIYLAKILEACHLAKSAGRPQKST
ncbi:MAG: hypothetical protein GY854_14980 [Deltaproteobacteria bacterium]|nr:hypothetical protein [Deltaproteobacteria bacterium]